MNPTIQMPDSFYPTPPALVSKMLEGIDFKKQFTFLEPEAGTGAIIRELATKANINYSYKNQIDIDCIEKDINLQQILKYNFSEGRKNNIWNKKREIEDSRKYNHELGEYESLTMEQKYDLENLRIEELTFPYNGIHLVHDDFLTFSTYKKYDAIIMNPPFDEGDLHLIKAIELQKDGGYICCLLNAETVKNPFTNTRKHLATLLSQYGADIKYLSGEFNSPEAERKTDVEIAIIKISIPEKPKVSFIFETLNKAKEEQESKKDPTAVSSGDFIQNIVEQFNFEVKGTLKLIDEYEAVKPYMLRSFDKEEDGSSILTLSLYDSSRSYHQEIDKNDYMQIVRMKYWKALFKNPEFTGKLTSNLQKDFYSMVETLKDYDFTVFNIKAIQAQMNASLIKGVEQTILDLFDKLSAEHSWYPECSNNIHYFSGWATNKAYKVNKKVIMPIHGAFSSYSWNRETFSTSTVYGVMSDIEKVFDYLDMGETCQVDLHARLRTANAEGQTSKIPLKYFKITLYKKGTCHIEFTNLELLEKFNIYGCQRKNWLPPAYGRKHYDDMTIIEKATIDEFQGKESYEKIVSNQRYYLVETSDLLMLPANTSMEAVI